MVPLRTDFNDIWIKMECFPFTKMSCTKSWWRHQMETFSALLAICAGNSPVTAEFPAQRPLTRSFDVFFDLCRINGWVNNREAGDLRRNRAHYDVIVMYLHSLPECHTRGSIGTPIDPWEGVSQLHVVSRQRVSWVGDTQSGFHSMGRGRCT